jgi:hypothetical protein
MRQREDDVKVRDGQQLSPALGEPAGAGVALHRPRLRWRKSGYRMLESEHTRTVEAIRVG